jgi:hypothetical protein
MKSILRFLPVVLGFLLLIGCSSQAVSPEAVSEPRPTLNPMEEELTRNDPGTSEDYVYQWAEEAEASSEFASPEWSAENALGAPDSPGCGDYQFAWASAASDSIDTLVLKYSTPVYPIKIVIYQIFNPDQVVKVEVLDPDRGGYYTVLQKNPTRVDRPCPYQLEVLIDGIDFLTNTIRITVDQSQLGLGWNEIDAVQLIGLVDQP